MSAAADGEEVPHTRGHDVSVKRGGAAATPRSSKCARQDLVANATTTSTTSSSEGLKEIHPETTVQTEEPVAEEDVVWTELPGEMCDVVVGQLTRVKAPPLPSLLGRTLKTLVKKWNKLTLDQQVAAVSVGDGHVLMTGVSEDAFARVADEPFCRRLWWADNNIIIDRVPTEYRETVAQELGIRCICWLAANGGMDLSDSLTSVGATRYRSPGNSREADNGLCPENAVGPPGQPAHPTVVFEVMYSETRTDAKRKLAHWFALSGVRHVIIVWIRNKPYTRATERVPGEKMSAGASPVLVWHYIRTPGIEVVPPFNLAPPLQPMGPANGDPPIQYPIDIGSDWKKRCEEERPPRAHGYGELVIEIPRSDIFHTVPGGTFPPNFPDHLELDLFSVFRRLRGCTPTPANFV